MKKYAFLTVLVCGFLTSFATKSFNFKDEGEPSSTTFKDRTPCGNFKDVQLPNVFSPNNDGKNDIFYLEGLDVCVENYEMFVYDRWGVKIFESTNINVQWDGRLLSGKEAKDGTYYYIFNVKNINGEQEKVSGFITVVR